jgi:hypothetical protein
MSGSLAALIAIPVVAGVLLAVWITAVFYAKRHPASGPGRPARRGIIGGTFQGDRRQQMPRRDAPAVNAPPAGQGPDEDAQTREGQTREGQNDPGSRT